MTKLYILEIILKSYSLISAHKLRGSKSTFFQNGNVGLKSKF